jgi:hypothetical protein
MLILLINMKLVRPRYVTYKIYHIKLGENMSKIISDLNSELLSVRKEMLYPDKEVVDLFKKYKIISSKYESRFKRGKRARVALEKAMQSVAEATLIIRSMDNPYGSLWSRKGIHMYAPNTMTVVAGNVVVFAEIVKWSDSSRLYKSDLRKAKAVIQSYAKKVSKYVDQNTGKVSASQKRKKSAQTRSDELDVLMELNLHDIDREVREYSKNSLSLKRKAFAIAKKLYSHINDWDSATNRKEALALKNKDDKWGIEEGLLLKHSMIPYADMGITGFNVNSGTIRIKMHTAVIGVDMGNQKVDKSKYWDPETHIEYGRGWKVSFGIVTPYGTGTTEDLQKLGLNTAIVIGADDKLPPPPPPKKPSAPPDPDCKAACGVNPCTPVDAGDETDECKSWKACIAACP